MSSDMLGTSEGCVADRTFVVASHGERREEEMVVGWLKLQTLSLSLPPRRSSGAMSCLALLI